MITTSFPFDYLKNCIFPITGTAVCINKFDATGSLIGKEKSFEECFTSPIQVIVKTGLTQIAKISLLDYDKSTNLITYGNVIPLLGTQPRPYERHVNNNIVDEQNQTLSSSNWIEFGPYPIYSTSVLYQVSVTMTFTTTITITYDPELPNYDTIIVIPYLSQYNVSGSGYDTFSETRSLTSLHVSDSYGEDPIIPNWDTIELRSQVRSYGYSGPCNAELNITITELNYTCNGKSVTSGDATIFWYDDPSTVYTLEYPDE